MIILETNEVYQLNQDTYSRMTQQFISQERECSQCHNDVQFMSHTYQERRIIIKNEEQHINFIQVKCPKCHSTHIILLDTMLPYSYISLEDATDIISKYLHHEKVSKILNDYLYYDENIIRRLIKRYEQTWKNIITDMDMETIKQECLINRHQQFLQKKGINRTYIYHSIDDDWKLINPSSKIEL